MKKILLNLFLIGAVISYFYFSVIVPIEKKTPDFKVYFDSSKILFSSQPHKVYSTIIEKTDFNYLPFIGFFMLPFLVLKYNTAFILWLILNHIIYFACIFFIFKIFNKKFNIYFFIIFLFFKPCWDTFKFGQINIIVLFFLLLFIYYFSKNKIISAFFLALSIMLKLTPALFLFFCLKYNKKIFLICVLFLIALLSVSILIFGMNTHIHYLKKIINTAQYNVKGDPVNISFNSLYYRLFSNDNGFAVNYFNMDFLIRPLTLITSLFFMIFYFYFLFNSKNFSIDFLFTLISLLIIHTQTWEHHLVFLIPVFFYLFLQYKNSNTFKRSIIIILFLIIAGKIGYDRTIYQQGIYLITLGSIKLWGLVLLWFFFIYSNFKKRGELKNANIN